MSSIINNSGHRIACRALYKALLAHSSKLPSAGPLQSEAIKRIKHEFKKNRKVRGVKELQRILSEAYGHERILRAAISGDVPSLTHLTTHLANLRAITTPQPSRPKPPPPPPSPPLTRLEKAHLRNVQRKAHRLALGLPPKSALRKKPRVWQPKRFLFPLMTTANGFPLLRRRGTPTSEKTATTIKNLIKQKQKRQDILESLEDTLELARWEDQWDQILLPELLRARLDAQVGVVGEGRWEDQVRWSMDEVAKAMRKRDVRSKELADEFWEIEQRGRKKYAFILKVRRDKRYTRNKKRRAAVLEERRKLEKELSKCVGGGKVNPQEMERLKGMTTSAFMNMARLRLAEVEKLKEKEKGIPTTLQHTTQET